MTSELVAGPASLTSVKHAYDTVADDYAAMLPDARAEAPLDLAMIDAFVSAVGGGGRVLDAGCGTGRMSGYLAARGVLVMGVDLSPGMIQRARRDHPTIDFAVASISALPYATHSFDGVILWYSTIHTHRDEQAGLYREVSRVLQPGGHLIVGFQSGAGVHDTARTYRRFGHDVTLVRERFSPDDVAAWMTAAGFREQSRLIRRPAGTERDDQAVLIGCRVQRERLPR